MEQSRLNIAQILNKGNDYSNEIMKNVRNNLRVALPGIIQSFNRIEQTVTVQPVLREEIIKPDQSTQVVQLPLLLDVPIYMPRAGDCILTMPIKQGDECLVIFSDMCIDAWWTYGGIQNQIEKRRHDLSDAIALTGIWSQPNRINGYSTDATELRTLSGKTKISLKEDEIDLQAENIKINGENISL